MEVTIITFATYYKFEAIHRYCPYTVGGYYKEHEQQEVGITGISLNNEILKSINTSNSNTISLFCLQKNYLEVFWTCCLDFPLLSVSLHAFNSWFSPPFSPNCLSLGHQSPIYYKMPWSVLNFHLTWQHQ